MFTGILAYNLNLFIYIFAFENVLFIMNILTYPLKLHLECTLYKDQFSTHFVLDRRCLKC